MRNYQNTLATLSLALVVLFPGAAFPHSGRTDASGCHQDHKRGGYHCHGRETPRQSPQSLTETTRESIRIFPSSSPVLSEKKRGELGITVAPQEKSCLALIKQYGKATIIRTILLTRGSQITIEAEGKLQTANGTPDDNYVTPRTICADIQHAGLSVEEFSTRLQERKRLLAQEGAQATEQERRLLEGLTGEERPLAEQKADREAGQRIEAARQRIKAEQAARVTTAYPPMPRREAVERTTPQFHTAPTGVSQLAIYDIQAYCRKVADAVGGSYQIEETCRRSEQEGREKLMVLTIPAEVSSYCQKVGQAVGGSYQIMLTCTESEIGAKNRLN